MQMGKFPNPYKKGKKKCSLSKKYSLYLFDLHPLRTPTAQIHTHSSACYCSFTEQEDGNETQLHLIITWQAEDVYYLFWIILFTERNYYVCV